MGGFSGPLNAVMDTTLWLHSVNVIGVELDAAGVAGRRVAWVTGASRGVGRGVAASLGAAGWAVYVTARSSAAGRTSHLPGTVEEAAAAVTAAGGEGVPVVCDHADDVAVAAVARRILAERGRLDLLVNNVWGGYERINAGHWEESKAPLWEQPVDEFDAMFARGVRAHYVTLALCAPMLMSTQASLVVTISNAVDADEHSIYAMAKTADDRLSLTAARQLREYQVASVAVHPGMVRTEGVLQFAEYLDLTGSQSPEGVGRAIAALAGDPDVLSLTGQVLAIDTLATRYGVDVAS